MTPYQAELYHYGIKGQKHGFRRFQNEDGSLTEAGKTRYLSGNKLKERVAKASESARSQESGVPATYKFRNNAVAEGSKSDSSEISGQDKRKDMQDPNVLTNGPKLDANKKVDDVGPIREPPPGIRRETERPVSELTTEEKMKKGRAAIKKFLSGGG